MTKFPDEFYKAKILIDFDKDHQTLNFEGCYPTICLALARAIQEMAAKSGDQLTEEAILSEIKNSLDFIKKEAHPLLDDVNDRIQNVIQDALKKEFGGLAGIQVIAAESAAELLKHLLASERAKERTKNEN